MGGCGFKSILHRFQYDKLLISPVPPSTGHKRLNQMEAIGAFDHLWPLDADPLVCLQSSVLSIHVVPSHSNWGSAGACCSPIHPCRLEKMHSNMVQAPALPNLGMCVL
jgi:hypothetical protein